MFASRLRVREAEGDGMRPQLQDIYQITPVELYDLWKIYSPPVQLTPFEMLVMYGEIEERDGK